MLETFQATLMRDTVQEVDVSPFRNMQDVIKIPGNTITEHQFCFCTHLNAAKRIQPFNAQPPKSFTYAEKKEFIDVSKCYALRL